MRNEVSHDDGACDEVGDAANILVSMGLASDSEYCGVEHEDGDERRLMERRTRKRQNNLMVYLPAGLLFEDGRLY